MKKEIYFTITGCNHYLGFGVFKRHMMVYLKKDKDNEYDKEAIEVDVPGLGKVGYVANSTYTVLGDSMSAGRIYDKIGKKAKGKVRYITEKGIVCGLK